MDTTIKHKPFLKWAGGKRQLLPAIRERMPERFDTYIEPFVGGGAVLFDILSQRTDVKKVVINDINRTLCDTYCVVRDMPETLIPLLEDMEKEYLSYIGTLREIMYYKIRGEFNKGVCGNDTDISIIVADFIFLNRTCFNGLYRENSKGEFNVPYAEYMAPKICDKGTLLADSEALRNVIIRCNDYTDVECEIDGDTFVYMDPPYRPVSDTSSFNSYCKEGFDDKEQLRLREFCDKLNDMGVKFMLSNSDSPFFDELYKGYYIERVPARRNINSKGDRRGAVTELLIKNY